MPAEVTFSSPAELSLLSQLDSRRRRFLQRAKGLPVAGKAFANDSVGNFEAADSLATVERINRHRYRLGEVSIDGFLRARSSLSHAGTLRASAGSQKPRDRGAAACTLKSVKLSDDRIGILDRTVYFDDIAPSLSCCVLSQMLRG